jgi:hypothetical protein
MTGPTDELTDSNLPLLPGLEVGVELLESRRSFSGPSTRGKIVEANQARVQAILTARAIGASVRQVCAAYQCGAHTLAEIERRHGSKLATLKDRIARRLGVFVELGLDRMLTGVDSMDLDKLPVAVAIAIDKLQILTGEPSVIVGNNDGPRRFSVQALHDRLDDAIDVTPTATGLDGQTGGQRATPYPVAIGDQDADEETDAT